MDQNYLLEKWLKGTLSKEEAEAFDQLEEAGFYKQILKDAKAFGADQFHNVPNFKTFKQSQLQRKSTSRKILWYRIAAVLVVGLLCSLYFFNIRSISYSSGIGEQLAVNLPDNSSVRLNAESEISYKASDWQEHRTVQLNGEAFFKVAKGSRFDVLTDAGTVSVLGTEFTVKHREAFFEVACFEGHVRVKTSEKTTELLAGQTLRILDGVFSEANTNRTEPLWIEKLSSFDEVPLGEVLKELERQFGVRVEFSEIISERLFTGVFPHDDLEKALTAVTQPLQLTFEIKAENVVINSPGAP